LHIHIFALNKQYIMFAKKAIVDFSKKATSLRGMTVRFNSNEGATGAVRPNGSSDNFRVSILAWS